MIYEEARLIAEKIVALLRPACDRIEIAGSIRRLKPDPGDIEIVAQPDPRPRPVFGQPNVITHLDAILKSLDNPDEPLRLQLCLGGPKYKKFWISLDGGQTQLIKLDLFLVTPPSDWGCQYLIRTGPAEFSHWIVTPQSHGGGMPDGYHLIDGRIMDSANTRHIRCEYERDFLHFCGLDWIEPCDRHPIIRRKAPKPAAGHILQPS